MATVALFIAVFCFMFIIYSCFIYEGKVFSKSFIPIFKLFIFTLFFFSCFLYNENSTFEKNEETYNRFYIKNKLKLDKQILDEKCKALQKSIIDGLQVCKSGMDVNPLTYNLTANKRITILIKDDVLYKDSFFRRKTYVLNLKAMAKHFDPSNKYEESLNSYLRNDYRGGPTYLKLIKEMDLCDKYFSGQKGCGITFKVVPINEMPVGQIYVVRQFEYGDN